MMDSEMMKNLMICLAVLIQPTYIQIELLWHILYFAVALPGTKQCLVYTVRQE